MKNLGMAYGIRKKNKMAKGGPVSAKTESRPMPEAESEDRHEIARNSTKKALQDADWTGQSTTRQAQSKPKVQAIKHPRMVPTNAFSTKLYGREEHLEDSANPGPYDQQPGRDLDEEDAKKQGSNPDMPKPHTTAKAYAKGGHVEAEYGKGPENDELDEPAGLEEDDDQRRPAVDEYMTGHMEMLAEGGMLDSDDSEDQPEDEDDAENYSSITASIMARRDRMHAAIDSGAHDMDEAVRMADGGMVDIDENAEEQPNAYYARNEDAALKENFDSDIDDMTQPMDSNEHGRELSDEDSHDAVDSIRKKMMSRRQFKKA